MIETRLIADGRILLTSLCACDGSLSAASRGDITMSSAGDLATGLPFAKRTRGYIVHFIPRRGRLYLNRGRAKHQILQPFTQR